MKQKNKFTWNEVKKIEKFKSDDFFVIVNDEKMAQIMKESFEENTQLPQIKGILELLATQ